MGRDTFHLTRLLIHQTKKNPKKSKSQLKTRMKSLFVISDRQMQANMERFTCLGRSSSSMKELWIKIMTEEFKRITESYAIFSMQNPGTLAPETILNSKGLPMYGWKKIMCFYCCNIQRENCKSIANATGTNPFSSFSLKVEWFYKPFFVFIEKNLSQVSQIRYLLSTLLLQATMQFRKCFYTLTTNLEWVFQK